MKFNKITAAFTASALAAAAMTVSAYAVDAEGPDGMAGIAFASGDWTSQYWLNNTEYASEATTAIVTGNGTYTVSVDAKTTVEDEETGEEVTTDGAKGLAFAALQIVNGEALFPGAVITIDSVKLDGVELAFTGTPYTSSDEGVTTRVNLYNEWVSEVPADARGVVEDSTARPIDNSVFGEWNNLTVTFTVSGADAAAPADAEDTTENDAAPAAGDVDAATDSSKGSPDTGIADVAAVAGIAVLAAGAVVVAKKRK